jgi:hypothetical protein
MVIPSGAQYVEVLIDLPIVLIVQQLVARGSSLIGKRSYNKALTEGATDLWEALA